MKRSLAPVGTIGACPFFLSHATTTCSRADKPAPWQTSRPAAVIRSLCSVRDRPSFQRRHLHRLQRRRQDGRGVDAAWARRGRGVAFANGLGLRPGSDLDTIPQVLGKFELGSDEYSIGLALQQIAPYLRTGDPLPASFTVPIVREERRPKLVATYGSTKVAEFAAGNIGQAKAGPMTPPDVTADSSRW